MKRHISEYQSSEFHNGRAAGSGIIEDNYSDESYPDKYPNRYKNGIDFVSRKEDLNGPVIIIQEGRK